MSSIISDSEISRPSTYCLHTKSRRGDISVSLCFNWSRREESNPRQADYKSAALPTELRRRWIGDSILLCRMWQRFHNQSRCARFQEKLV